ncbi:bifunctional heparan sulfate N-deacetylase/N-sulfotransferase 4-like [Acanthaster planci]|uniref:[heparan sulfate]-glucosamine N-sulfotransferase n=1 Tax=Acanthaster planci TaxID=133434 RepID=A0A8B7ZKZ6_ACAPL|nr:bifunctional heparan sulfate N-deacetylase/N-sulfotransferase 4-like [Acanthaster planci]XP_022105720.1 bifunctional heparan sulfate N-deacetylase/N-sulfotransferase 4-like [Acanthaster planci]XP_022105721.1 bifunctional heparan sulfate N-deacetylase/N-sulfotransferase 4-like [Acanthaster planci]XP_022105722.1 bifunctional heparan sulfate N-deacetylase/N-sulfotransferase 4-like [Acanthaster planci]XP_022105723.1 bifunctional heparan sulfate N-deacetylase/N-sulfotransferase 4-like [Acanthaste
MMNLIRYSSMTSIKKIMLVLVLLSLLSIWFLSYNMMTPLRGEHDKDLHLKLDPSHPLGAEERSARHRQGKHTPLADQDDLRVIPSALVITERDDLVFAYNITSALEANHIDYTSVFVKERRWPRLEHKRTGKFAVIIFQSIHSYISLDAFILRTVHEYCKKYNVGIMAFAVVREDDNGYTRQVGQLPVYMDQRLSLKDLTVNLAASDILHITKAGQFINGTLPYNDWTVFRTDHESYKPLVQAKMLSQDSLELHSPSEVLHTTVLLDQGLYDGIQRIFIGNNFRFWLHYILFLDSVAFLSHRLLQKSLDRYIQVDIDDIFVGMKGIRMTTDDVEALLLEQEVLADKIPGFTFKLGFSGKFFKRGNEAEKAGDEALVAQADKFAWFPHMWNHAQPHMFTNQSQLIADMRKNFRFAKIHQIPVKFSYAVAPHHSGVYPVYPMLYSAWKQVWGIKATSTEEYPSLRPARKRKGFIYKDIMVLPRQTCGLFTHTIVMKQYPGGRERLDGSIYGGELFQTIVDNPINVYMTHMTNYGSDRLALYTFDNVISFVQKWTNLRLKAAPPLELAKKYFDMFPEEREPVWTNPCYDKRHLEILPEKQNCHRLPSFLVIGPQKTGTTALYTFLSLHPNIRSNLPSEETFEEVQFFSNSKNYNKGLEWYLNFFPQVDNTSADVLFEKSATYFDNLHAPRRAHWLLPKAKLIAILIDPAKRAYSWYQHERAHENPASMNYTFHEVLTSGLEAPRPVALLRNRCLDPGKYIQHLQRWLEFYPPTQLMVLDGDLLRADPTVAMLKIQKFLRLKEVVDFSDKIIYDDKKGFYCPVFKKGHTRCLGKSKGRKYPPMDVDTETYLRHYYQGFNVQLEAFLSGIDQPVPAWLNEALTER